MQNVGGICLVKMSDIAKEAGVSVSTVSRVMNNSAAISAQTRARILEAAAQLGYHRRPEPLIPSKANNVAGVIVPDMMSDYYARFLDAVVEEFAKKGLSALISISHFRTEEAILAVKQMYGCKVKCLLIIIDDCEVVSEQLLTVVRDAHLPVMFITAAYISDMDFDCLYVDEMRSSVMAVEHLLHRGYKDLAFVGELYTANRRDIFLKTMRRFKMPVRPELIRIGAERAELGGYLRTKELLALQKLPDAIYASYDQLAIGVIHAIREAGLRIPQDIAVIGSTGMPLSGYIEGGLTTVTSPLNEMVSIAVRILVRRIEMPFSQPQQIAIKPILSVRATT